MKMVLKSALAVLTLIVSLGAAAAQSSPGWYQGFVPTPAQWNAAFAAKQDVLPGTPCYVTGCTLLGELVTLPSSASSAGFSLPPGTAPTSPNDGDLWSTSSGFYGQINGITVGIFTTATRIPLAGNTTYYFRTDGNDTECTGLTDAAYVSGGYPQACAFATPQTLASAVANTIDTRGYNVTFKGGNQGTPESFPGFTIYTITGGGAVYVEPSPSGTTITGGNGGITLKNTLAQVFIGPVTIATTGGYGNIVVEGQSVLLPDQTNGGPTFAGATGAAEANIWCHDNQANVLWDNSSDTISGNSSYHIFAENGCTVFYENQHTTFSTAVTISGAFVAASAGGVVQSVSSTFTNKSNLTGGLQWSATANGVINPEGSGCGLNAYFPGQYAGIASGGGQCTDDATSQLGIPYLQGTQNVGYLTNPGAGGLIYWGAGPQWTTLAGNTTGNAVLTESSAGVPGWSGLGTNVAAALGVAGGAAFPSVLGQSHIPFVLVSSGTMGNNGALSGITALAGGALNAYVYMPAGAIASGSAAGWYYAVFSSNTAATLYNNTYTSGTPTIPASPTAFSTTGPGAYTQSTSYINAYTLPIAGNLIGANGTIRTTGGLTFNNSAGFKTWALQYNGYTFGDYSGSTETNAGFLGGFSNRGVTNIQVSLTSFPMITGTTTLGPYYGSIDSTTTHNLVALLNLATASDTLTLETIVVELLPGVP